MWICKALAFDRDKVVYDSTHNLKGVCNDSDSHQLLAVVATVHHESIRQALDDGALCFAELLGRVFAGRVWEVDWITDLDIVTIARLVPE